MTRNPRLEAFLHARYEYDTCEPSSQVRCEANLFALATELAATYRQASGQSITVDDLFQITSDAYHEYRRTQVLQQRSRLSRPR